ncbi:MAG: hypothetical protein JEZ11_19940 [Desulfobacterales bacterium]|nr:hypothetical protein [Desulfobacterales bacterium]
METMPVGLKNIDRDRQLSSRRYHKGIAHASQAANDRVSASSSGHGADMVSRLEYEGGLYHILSRGNERKDIYYDDQDRLSFLDICQRAFPSGPIQAKPLDLVCTNVLVHLARCFCNGFNWFCPECYPQKLRIEFRIETWRSAFF